MTQIDEKAYQHALQMNRGKTFSMENADECFRYFISCYEAAKPKGDDIREALREMIYETTHGCPMEDDGSHKCIISAKTLEKARKAYHGSASSNEH